MNAALAVAEDLARHTVLVTRPADQAAQLIQRLEQLGARPVPLPTLLIRPVRPAPALDAALGSVEVAHWAVFVSRNAVRYGLELLAQRGQRLGQHCRIAAIGQGTASALREHGQPVAVKPSQGYTSESLLEQPAFDVHAGSRVVIFRGEGGRAVLGDALKERGARVRYVEVYRRELPELDVGSALREWARGQQRWVIVTSSEGLNNLLQMAGGAAEELRQAHLVTVSQRVANAARRAGWKAPVLVAREASDDAIITAITAAVEAQ